MNGLCVQELWLEHAIFDLRLVPVTEFPVGQLTRAFMTQEHRMNV